MDKNLCDTCLYERESCDAKQQAYGEKDEVIKCDAFIAVAPSQELEPEVSLSDIVTNEQADKKASAMLSRIDRMTEFKPTNLGNCSSCGSPLKEIPVNSRVRAIVCNNPRCGLFRERIKIYSIPKQSFITGSIIAEHKHQYKGKNNHCIVPSCNHIRIRRNRKGGVN